MNIEMHSAVKKLSSLLAQISAQAHVTDKDNEKLKCHTIIENNALFSNTLFSTYSDKFSPYIKEIENEILSLNRLLASNKEQFSYALIERVEQQILALINALNSNKSMHEEANYRLKKIKAIKAKNYKKALVSVVQPSQNLYQKLAENHEFERRLVDMLNDKESQRTQSNANNSQRLSEEVLVLHQRLGRCRHAISQIERQIELAEKR